MTRGTVSGLYAGCVIATGVALLVQFVPREYPRPYLALTLLAVALGLSTFKLRLPLGRDNSTMTMAYAVDFVALVMVGPGLAMVLAAAGVLMRCTVRVTQSQPLHRTAFSMASAVIAVQAAGWVWTVLGGTAAAPSFTTLVAPLSMAAAAYFVVHSTLVAAALALSSAVPVARKWYGELFGGAPAYFLSAAVAGMVPLITAYDAYVLIPLAASPLYISYRAYQMSVHRIQKERRHAQELAGMIATTQQALTRATQSEAALAAEKDRLVLESARLAVTLRTISDGVISVDVGGAVRLMNEGAQKLASAARRDHGDLKLCTILGSLGFSDGECGSALERVLHDGVPVRLRKDLGTGATLQLVEVTGTPTRDADGQVAGAVWVLRDISDLARIEHERAKTARLESLGVLAGGLAHDFNNILMGVVGNLSLAQAMVRPDEAKLNERLTRAAAACARARGVTNQLLTFSKGGAPVKTTASVRELVMECTRFALSGSPVAPHFDIACDLWAAEVDTAQIGQVVQNLVLNGMQAMPRGGVIEVSLQNVQLEAEPMPKAASLPSGKYVSLTVQDSGSGIPADVVGHIFDPYFTTKEKGSGLGLAISYSIIRAHGGTIAVESEPGVGSKFTVFLPASSGPVAQVVPGPSDVTRGRCGRVLLMDDEEIVAEVAQEMLESLGYAAQVSASGSDAVERFRDAEAQGNPFDAVILDLTVPGGMGGSEAVTHIKNIRPDVPVIVASGYADDSVLARYREYGFDGVLPKPFGIADLRQALQGVEVATGAPPRARPALEVSSDESGLVQVLAN